MRRRKTPAPNRLHTPRRGNTPNIQWIKTDRHLMSGALFRRGFDVKLDAMGATLNNGVNTKNVFATGGTSTIKCDKI
jgi:hypothetical protein